MYVNVARRSRRFKARLRAGGCCEECLYKPNDEMHPRCRLVQEELETEILRALRERLRWADLAA